MNYLNLLDLTGLADTFINSWVGPVFMVIMAAVAIKFLISGQIRAAIVFGAVAIIVAIFIFLGDVFFGANGIFTRQARNLGEELGGNTIFFIQSLFR